MHPRTTVMPPLARKVCEALPLTAWCLWMLSSRPLASSISWQHRKIAGSNVELTRAYSQSLGQVEMEFYSLCLMRVGSLGWFLTQRKKASTATVIMFRANSAQALQQAASFPEAFGSRAFPPPPKSKGGKRDHVDGGGVRKCRLVSISGATLSPRGTSDEVTGHVGKQDEPDTRKKGRFCYSWKSRSPEKRLQKASCRWSHWL